MIRLLSLGLAASAALILTPLMNAENTPTTKRVALVIDDGPIPAHNAKLLALLARDHVHVTFSHVGQNVVAHPGLAKAAAEAGHEIINHSYTHPHLKTLSDAEIERQAADTSAAITKATGKAPTWFWSPFLEHDDRVDADVRRATGLEHFPFTKYHFIGSKDWEAGTTAEQFRANSTTGIVDGTVILMHEWPEVTLANLDWVIAELRKQGAVFVTFSELAGRGKP
ncbi:MAG TPA: polysaccharide deacetylase family protein [Candidatus Didemnitutus sp.]|jgi:endo-1,4-beta-xylanase